MLEIGSLRLKYSLVWQTPHARRGYLTALVRKQQQAPPPLTGDASNRRIINKHQPQTDTNTNQRNLLAVISATAIGASQANLASFLLLLYCVVWHAQRPPKLVLIDHAPPILEKGWFKNDGEHSPSSRGRERSRSRAIGLQTVPVYVLNSQDLEVLVGLCCYLTFVCLLERYVQSFASSRIPIDIPLRYCV